MAEATQTKQKSLAELQAELATARADLAAAVRGHQAGELQNPRVLRATRKQIARLLTAISAAQAAEQEGDN